MTNKKFYSKKISNILIISSSMKYFKKIEDSLKFLKKENDKSFYKVNRYLKIIFITDKVKFFNELFTKDRIWMTGYNIFNEKTYDFKYIASLFLHESHHITQYLSGHKNTGTKAEKMAYLIQRRFLKKIKYNDAVKWLDDQYKDKWWKLMNKDEKNKNYFRKLLSLYKNKKLKIRNVKI
jgi:hypothetical protein